MTQTNTIQKTTPGFPAWLSIVRIVLGILLVWKGLVFIRDTSVLESMIEQTGIGVFSNSSRAVAIVVSLLSLICGLFITVGFFTRIVCIIMLPIVLIAVFFVNFKNIDRNTVEMIGTIIVFLLLFVFAFKGSGGLSIDNFLRFSAVVDKTS